MGEQAVWKADGKKVLRNDLISAEDFKELMKVDEWNDVIIIAKGSHIQHYLNGKLVLDFDDQHPEKAFSEGILAFNYTRVSQCGQNLKIFVFFRTNTPMK